MDRLCHEAAKLETAVPLTAHENSRLQDEGQETQCPGETAEVLSLTSLAASTRAYAKIIADVNELDLKDLIRPRPTEARR
jgi:hypothetical protein